MTRGLAFYDTIAGTFYFYVVAAWGGCAFITETSSLRAFVLILTARFRLAWISRPPQLVNAGAVRRLSTREDVRSHGCRGCMCFCDRSPSPS